MIRTAFCALLFSPIAMADTAKVTVVYPDKEEKVFRFQPSDQPQSIALKSDMASCALIYNKEKKTNNYEILCAQAPTIEEIAVALEPGGKGILGVSGKPRFSTKEYCSDKIATELEISYSNTNTTPHTFDVYKLSILCEK